jgi:hypothetical protein
MTKFWTHRCSKSLECNNRCERFLPLGYANPHCEHSLNVCGCSQAASTLSLDMSRLDTLGLVLAQEQGFLRGMVLDCCAQLSASRHRDLNSSVQRQREQRQGPQPYGLMLSNVERSRKHWASAFLDFQRHCPEYVRRSARRREQLQHQSRGSSPAQISGGTGAHPSHPAMHPCRPPITGISSAPSSTAANAQPSAVVKGVSSRLSQLREYAAAVRIQHAARAWLFRHKLTKRRRGRAARVIQRAFRLFLARRTRYVTAANARLRAFALGVFAAKIQRWWRWYRYSPAVQLSNTARLHCSSAFLSSLCSSPLPVGCAAGRAFGLCVSDPISGLHQWTVSTSPTGTLPHSSLWRAPLPEPSGTPKLVLTCSSASRRGSAALSLVGAFPGSGFSAGCGVDGEVRNSQCASLLPSLRCEFRKIV